MASFLASLTISVIIPVVAFGRDCRRVAPSEIVTSHFWYFTLIYMAAFPLRAYLIVEGHVSPQVQRFESYAGNTPGLFAGTLMMATGIWLAAYAGFRGFATIDHPRAPGVVETPQQKRSPRPWLVAGFLTAAGVFTLMHLDPDWSLLDGAPYLARRYGAGFLWVLPELSSLCVISLFSYLVVSPSSRTSPYQIAFLVLLALAVSWISYTLQTRRSIAVILLAGVLCYVVWQRRHWILGAVAIVCSVFLSPVLELTRMIRHGLHAGASLAESVSGAITQLFWGKFITLLSISFEGADHLAQMLSKVSLRNAILGIDHGVSWLFNIGLALLPRSIWHDKPEVYGSFYEFRWLYPDSFDGNKATLAVPPSFAVDYLFGFGIFGAVIMAFLTGRFLAVCQHRLIAPTDNPALLAVCVFVFVFSFNLVRSGTALGQGLVLFCLVCLLSFGAKPTVAALRLIIADTMRIRSL